MSLASRTAARTHTSYPRQREQIPRTYEPTASDAWIVTAPHEMPRRDGGNRHPWGTHHVKCTGDSHTVCGLPTATWIAFWTLAVDPEDPAMCHQCADSIPHER